MPELWQHPAYQALARTAAARLGANNPGAVRAILALWTCEQAAGGPWPPFHNNPGNLTRRIGTLDAEPHWLATTAPGAGLLYRYSSPTVGAQAFAQYLLNSSRYPRAVAALRNGQAREAVQRITDAGYGTRQSCALSALDRIPALTPPPVQHVYVCQVQAARVRERPNLGARVVGHRSRGDQVIGHVIAGGPYPHAGTIRHDWLALRDGRYTAAALYRRHS